MDSRFINLSQLVILCWLCLNFAYCTDPDPTSIIIPNEWQLVTKGWPLEDISDTDRGKKTQFYYVSNQNKNMYWSIKQSFLSKFRGSSQIFKLSFKYWSDYEILKPQSVLMVNGIAETISDRYFPDYRGFWMECEYVLSFESLQKFFISINPGDNQTIVAFKDFKIKYETQDQNGKSSHSSVNPIDSETGILLNKWKSYSQSEDMSVEKRKFLYFSDECNSNCSLKISGINIPNSKTVTKSQISFKLLTNDAHIQFGKVQIDSDSSTPLDYNHINGMEFKIITKKSKLNQISYVAIKDIIIEIFHYNTSDKSKTNTSTVFGCNETKCENWKSTNSMEWIKPSNKLIEKNTVYYYPTDRENSLDLLQDIDVNKNCFTINYWADSKSDARISVNFKVINESKSDTILRVSARADRFERTDFCLRDLIALNARKYIISFEVSLNKYNVGVIGFALSIAHFEPETQVWNFTENVRTFLQPMRPHSDEDELNKDEWKMDWKQISPKREGIFEFKQNYVQFSAFTDTKSHSTAQLISRWIKYDQNLHSIDPIYSVNVSDYKMFNNFKISVKVCDWMSHCSDVIQQIQQSKDPNTKTFSFKFNRLRNSQFIKLLFYIQYFEPIYYEEKDGFEVRFGLKLIHFGDPCFQREKCKNNGICVSDPKINVPNKVICDCDQSYTGQFCEKPDYCGTKIGDKPSGAKVCKDIKMRCESLDDTFRCICKEPNIFWDSKNCSSLTSPVLKDKWNPKNSSDKIVFYFNELNKKINLDQKDICLNLEYNSNQTVELNVRYSHQMSNKEDQLFGVSLINQSNAQNFNFCLRDFRYTIDQNFNLSFQIFSVINNYYGPNTFSLTKVTLSSRDIKNAVKYIDNTGMVGSDLQTRQWNSFPPNIFRNSADTNFSTSLNVNLSPKTSMKVLLVSDWIMNDKAFYNSENFYQIVYNKDRSQYLRVNQRIIYEENNELKSDFQSVNLRANTNTEGEYTTVKNRFSVPNNIKSVFKLMFEITLSNTDKTQIPLNLTFKALSIGNPCFRNYGEESVCRGGGTCQAFGPNDYHCDCKKDLSGKNCQFNDFCNKMTMDSRLTNEEFCGIFPKLVDTTDKNCLLKSSNSFECKCPESDFEWNSELKRCVRNGFTESSVSCLDRSCDIFNSITEDCKWSNPNMPKVNRGSDTDLPFYFTTKSDSQLNIQINNLNNKNDACFAFKYQLSNASKLYIAYNNIKAITLTPNQAQDWYPMINDWQKICARSLVKDVDKKFNITFISNLKNNDKDMVALRFDQSSDILRSDRDMKLQNELPFLTHNNFTDSFAFKNQWPLSLPNNYWDVNEKGYITFEASDSIGNQTSYLMSNWLKKGIEGYKLRFRIKTDSFENYLLSIIVYDIKMQIKQTSSIVIGDKNLNQTARTYNATDSVIIPIDKMDTSFRIGLKVDQNRKDSSQGIKFELSSIDLGDPCVTDQDLSQPCLNGGTCLSLGPVDKYHCKCAEGFTNNNCQDADYCNYTQTINNDPIKGSDYCTQNSFGNCINGGFANFSCDCKSGMYWDYSSLKCIVEPKCIGNDCECRKGYINVNLKVNGSVICEKFNICNTTHRNLTKLNEKPCGTSEAICFPDSPEDYTCVCPRGYQNIEEKENSKCESLKCLFPSLNNCTQKCETDDKSKTGYKCLCAKFYEQKGDECDAKGKACNCKGKAFCDYDSNDCKCKDGYKPVNDKNGKNNGCEPDTTFSVTSSICPDGKVKNDSNSLLCDCGSHYTINDNKTCILNKICGKGGKGREKCDSQHALCMTDEKIVGNYSCVCPPGKQWIITEKNTTLCVDYCEVNDRQKNCTDMNAECNPFTNNTVTDKTLLCSCRAGYAWNKDKTECVIGKYTVVFSLMIKNTFIDQKNNKILDKFQNQRQSYRRKRNTDANKYSADLIGFFEDIKSMREENKKLIDERNDKLSDIRLYRTLVHTLKPILEHTDYSEAKNSLKVQKCIYKSNKFFECSFTLTLEKEIKQYGNFSQQLIKLCINSSLPTEKSNCFFPKIDKSQNENSDSSQDLFSLIINKEYLAKSSINILKPCKDLNEKNLCPEPTYCVDDKELSIYSCHCNNDSFTQTDPQPLPYVQMNERAVKYHCKVRDDICKLKCPVSNGKCNSTTAVNVKVGDKWVAKPVCECKPKFKLTNHSECVGVCYGVSCGHGICKELESSGYCECSEGWNGDHCEKEHKVSVTVWVIVVSVLAALVLISIIIAIVFAVRARRSGSENISDHNLSEYANSTTYRVERSRKEVARQQSANVENNENHNNRRQDPPSFHRNE